MKCNIKYVGKQRTGTTKYYCTTHKSYAHDETGKKLDECLCDYKEEFDNVLDIKDNKVERLEIIYENILENVVPKVYINNKEFYGTLKYDDSLLSHKDLSGILLARINEIPLEEVKCNHCARYHSDNGKFAYTPHRTHLCLYCGRLFRVKERNIGSEITMIYSIPAIELNDNKIKIDDVCSIKYDLFKGDLTINNQKGNSILLKDQEVSIKDFLNDVLKDEF